MAQNITTISKGLAILSRLRIRSNHVFTDTFCFSLSCSSDIAMYVETCLVTAENFLNKLLPHPVAPLLPPFGMTRWAESANLTGKLEKFLCTTIWTSYPGKSNLRTPAIEILINHFINSGFEKSLLSLEPTLIFEQELVEVMEIFLIILLTDVATRILSVFLKERSLNTSMEAAVFPMDSWILDYKSMWTGRNC